MQEENDQQFLTPNLRFSIQKKAKLQKHSLSELHQEPLNKEKDAKIFVNNQKNYFISSVKKELQIENKLIKELKNKMMSSQDERLKKDGSKYSLKYRCFQGSKRVKSKKQNQNSKCQNSSLFTKTAYSTPFQKSQQTTNKTIEFIQKIRTSFIENQIEVLHPAYHLFAKKDSKSEKSAKKSVTDQIKEKKVSYRNLLKYSKSINCFSFQIYGEKPQWNNFQSYRNDFSKAKKYNSKHTSNRKSRVQS